MKSSKTTEVIVSYADLQPIGDLHGIFRNGSFINNNTMASPNSNLPKGRVKLQLFFTESTVHHANDRTCPRITIRSFPWFSLYL